MASRSLPLRVQQALLIAGILAAWLACCMPFKLLGWGWIASLAAGLFLGFCLLAAVFFFVDLANQARAKREWEREMQERADKERAAEEARKAAVPLTRDATLASRLASCVGATEEEIQARAMLHGHSDGDSWLHRLIEKEPARFPATLQSRLQSCSGKTEEELDRQAEENCPSSPPPEWVTKTG